MATLTKYNLKGDKTGDVKIDDAFADAEASSKSVKDYIVAIRKNKRQWSANTKDRSEVECTTKKPHAQKKLGRARQGSYVSPQFRGGGIVFGPKPKFDQHVKINKKERQAVIKSLLAEKIKNNQLHVLENISMDAPKTKTVSDFIKSVKLEKGTLFLGESNKIEKEVNGEKVSATAKSENHVAFAKSVKNLPRAKFALLTNSNGYDLMCAENVIITESALEELTNWLG